MPISLVAATLAGALAQELKPAIWLTQDGQILLDGRAFEARVVAPVKRIRLDGVYAWDFSSGRGGIHFGDLPELRLTSSMSVSVWLNLRSYVNDGPGAQILFRGDDRNGLDPYTLVVHHDGSVNFGVQDENHFGRSVAAEVPLHRWFYIVANFDADTGGLEMWLDGRLVGSALTARRPFAPLDPQYTPGVSIGNVQNEHGVHNQPLNGLVADLRLYRGVVRPKDLAVGGGGWAEPPAIKH